MGTGMILVSMVLALAGLTWFFSGALERRENPNQQVNSQLMGRDVVVRLQQNRQGHYVANGKINGQTVTFLLDTGATLVAVPGGLAERLNLERGIAQPTMTAAGTVTSYATRLEQVSLGDIVLNDVRASISPRMQGEAVLLGMSFLRELDLQQSDGELVLRQRR
jgi:aspartyl protease family protein